MHHRLSGFVIFAFCGLWALAASEMAYGQSDLVRVIDARIASAPERSRVVFDLSAETGYATFPVREPDRLVIELGGALLGEGVPNILKASGLIEKMTLGPLDQGTVRAVIFLSRPVEVSHIKLSPAENDMPARLVIELATGAREVFDAAAAAVEAQASSEQDQDRAATIQELSDDNGISDPSVDRGRPLVLLDPGHGGIDLGSRGVDGQLEKDIVLSIARKIRSKLNTLGRFDVALTRDSDRFLTLGERVQLARDNQANLFISLHADSFNQPFVRGGSVYTRDETATDVLDKVLAENENQSDLIAGFSLPEKEDAVVDILVDLMRRETRRQSFIAARQIVNIMNKNIPMRPHPLRQADFFVLQSPEVPSVLIELGFLSNEQDLRNLSQEQWQNRAADTVVQGIARYFDTDDQP